MTTITFVCLLVVSAFLFIQPADSSACVMTQSLVDSTSSCNGCTLTRSRLLGGSSCVGSTLTDSEVTNTQVSRSSTMTGSRASNSRVSRSTITRTPLNGRTVNGMTCTDGICGPN